MAGTGTSLYLGYICFRCCSVVPLWTGPPLATSLLNFKCFSYQPDETFSSCNSLLLLLFLFPFYFLLFLRNGCGIKYLCVSVFLTVLFSSEKIKKIAERRLIRTYRSLFISVNILCWRCNNNYNLILKTLIILIFVLCNACDYRIETG